GCATPVRPAKRRRWGRALRALAAAGALVALGACVASLRPERRSTRPRGVAQPRVGHDPAWPPHEEFPEPHFWSRQPEVRRADALLDAKRYAEAVAAYDEALALAVPRQPVRAGEPRQRQA